MDPIRELAWTLWDALQEGDLPGHLRSWWAVVTGRVTPDDPAGLPTPAGRMACAMGGADGEELAVPTT